MNSTFYEQLGGVAGVFEQWGTCERTVVACALARRVPWPGLKLVQRAVEAALMTHVEDERLERDANDETVITNLLTSRPEDDENEDGERLRQLLTLLPLLRPDNSRCKDAYVSVAPALVRRAVDTPRAAAAPDLCRQLLSYLLVHPALTHADQSTLTQWLRYLENHISGNRTESVWRQRIDPRLLPEPNIWSSGNTFRRTIGKNVEFRSILDNVDSFTTDSLQESFSKNGRDVDLSMDSEKLNFDAAISQPKSQRSNSLTPPSTNFLQMSSSAENLSDEPFMQKPRSFSLSSEHSLGQIRPIRVLYGTTGSETRLDDLRTNNFTEHPGMSTVGLWLKSLRLHKYVWLFTNISYDEMMAMDETYLEKLGVTKGARHKLLLSIRKLSERGAAVAAAGAALAACGVAGGGAGGAGGRVSATRALRVLRSVVLTPMAPHTSLPAAVVAALELASQCITRLQLSGPPGAPAGPPPGPDDDNADPMTLHCWIVEKALHHSGFTQPSLQESLRRMRHRLPPGQFYSHVRHLPQPYKQKWRVSHSAGYQKPARRWSGPRPPRAPHSPHPPHSPRPPRAPLDYSGLDALCLQMTEQAIN